MYSDIVIVGGGIAGLTAAAFLSKEGIDVLLLEKGEKCGGLVNSFERDGFIYDGGIRATENSGILFPMLRKLDINLEFVRNEITLGVEDQVLRIHSEQNLIDYQGLLNNLYPESRNEISEIIKQIKRIMSYVDVQYSIDNPAFLDLKEDCDYFIKKIFPWMVRYALIAPKINQVQVPVVSFLQRFTQNQALIDIITQHFFTKTPAFFALSYLRIYLDYYYPLGGTGIIPQEMVEFIQKHGGSIKNNLEVAAIYPVQKKLIDTLGNAYHYDQLIWAADQHSFYKKLELTDLSDIKTVDRINKRRSELEGAIGNDSVFTLYLAVDIDPAFFSDIASEHFFYTPLRTGESTAGPAPLNGDDNELKSWLKTLYKLSTFEISIPVLRDPKLAPPGKTGLIISLLFDYHLTKNISEMGWYDDFKETSEDWIIEVLNDSIYPGIKDAIIHKFSSTPLTIESVTANTHGAITGWSFTNHPLPAENRLPKIFSAIKTPIEGIFQAGQWTYSPAGLPISILTGKLASDRVLKKVRRWK